MAQHDYVLDNATGAAFRVDLNAVLQAIITQNSGSSAPTTTKPYMFWASTGDNKLKQRNALDTAWVDICELNTTLFSLNNVLGSVSATGTYPSLTATGAIIETGTNANGTYIKYANGRMECFRTLDMPPHALSTQVNVTGAWAATFASLESVQFSAQAQVGSGSAAKIGLMYYNGLWTSGSTVSTAVLSTYSYRAATNADADSVSFHVIGYGRWV